MVDLEGEREWLIQMTFNINVKLTPKHPSVNASEYLRNHKTSPQFFTQIKTNAIKFDAFNLFKELPEKSQVYYQNMTDEVGLGKSVGTGDNLVKHISEPKEREKLLRQMCIKLNQDLTHETKRKYIKNQPPKQFKLYDELFLLGVPLNTNHKHYHNGKNELQLYHIEHKNATKYLASYLGLLYQSKLSVQIPQPDLKQKTEFLIFDSSGLDITSLEFFEQVLAITANRGLRGKELIDCIPNAELRKNGKIIYQNMEVTHGL